MSVFTIAAEKALRTTPCRGLINGEVLQEFCPNGFTLKMESNKCAPGMVCAAVMVEFCQGHPGVKSIPKCVSADPKMKVMEPCPSFHLLKGDICVEDKK